MDRRKEILDLALEILKGSFVSNLEKIHLDYQKNAHDINSLFLDCFTKMKEETRFRQMKNEKGPVKYVAVSLLLSSTITRTYDFQIGFYDKTLYMDPTPIENYWHPNFIYRYLQDDIDFAAKIIKSKLIRIHPYEVEELRIQYSRVYHYIALLYLKMLLEMVFQSGIFEELLLEDEVSAVFNLLMEKHLYIYHYKRNEIVVA